MTHSEAHLTDFKKFEKPVCINVAKKGIFVNGIGSRTCIGDFRLSEGSTRRFKISSDSFCSGYCKESHLGVSCN